jgi:hypothetical protein
MLRVLGKKLGGRGNAIKIFPATRSFPMRMPKTTVLQRAEQGVRFSAAI